MLAFGNRHFAPEGASVCIVDAKTGAVADPRPRRPATGRPLAAPDFTLAPGPGRGRGNAAPARRAPGRGPSPRRGNPAMSAAAAPAGVAAMNPRTRVLLEGRIVPTLVRLAWPNILVMLAQASTGLIETWWVSRLGTDALAGMALVFPAS
jgi:hypothetical protein